MSEAAELVRSPIPLKLDFVVGFDDVFSIDVLVFYCNIGVSDVGIIPPSVILDTPVFIRWSHLSHSACCWCPDASSEGWDSLEDYFVALTAFLCISELDVNEHPLFPSFALRAFIKVCWHASSISYQSTRNLGTQKAGTRKPRP